MEVDSRPREPAANAPASLQPMGDVEPDNTLPRRALENITPSATEESRHAEPVEIRDRSDDTTARTTDDNVEDEESQPLKQQRYVKWGNKGRTVLLLVAWMLVGLGWALAHHFYYQSLHGSKVGSPARQNWAVRLGTAFAFLVVTCFRASCEVSYKQYIWTLFRRKAFTLEGIDDLFSATQDPFALMNFEFLRRAKAAYLVATVCWCIALAGIAPPATLSVVPGLFNDTQTVAWPPLDWESTKFRLLHDDTAYPTSEVQRIAELTAESMTILPPIPPSPNCSFSLRFFGPTLQCSLADTYQQAIFDEYAKAMAESPVMKVTKQSFESNQLTWGQSGLPRKKAPLMNIYSAFSPGSGRMGWFQRYRAPDYSKDAYNNWIPGIPYGLFDALHSGRGTRQQLWIQTADQAMVCTLGNASFAVSHEFVDSRQTKVEYTVSSFQPFLTPRWGRKLGTFIGHRPEWEGRNNSYMAVYLALSSMLNGNVSSSLHVEVKPLTVPTTAPNSGFDSFEGGRRDLAYDGNVTLDEGSSRILQTGLSACEDFVTGYWNGENVVGVGRKGPVRWREACSLWLAPNVVNAPQRVFRPSESDWAQKKLWGFPEVNNRLFTKPSWMCRNRTLLKAIEDLANNVTISLLSSSLAEPNATSVDVDRFLSVNIYSYDSRNLILSYSLALLCAVVCACVGCLALHYNGVAHSTAFSAIVATTRNHELDTLTEGRSLGALARGHMKTKVRFGEVRQNGKSMRHKGTVKSDESGHAAFGVADNVTGLRRGGMHV